MPHLLNEMKMNIFSKHMGGDDDFTIELIFVHAVYAIDESNLNCFLHWEHTLCHALH